MKENRKQELKIFALEIRGFLGNLKKKLKILTLQIRGRFTRSGKIKNLYLATHQKAGSQWMKAILSDPEIVRYTNLKVYPQHHYDGHEFHSRFPKKTFVPGLYISYNSYWLYLKKEKPYKTIYIYRDPRDFVVSWYWSAKETHTMSDQVKLIREKLLSMDLEDGISYSIRYLSEKFGQVRSWIELAEQDEDVLMIRFEDLVAQPSEKLRKVFFFLKIDIPDEVLLNIADKYSKENMRKKDLKKRAGKEKSHYRKQSSNHRKIFNEDHFKLFYSITGDLVEKLGYEIQEKIS